MGNRDKPRHEPRKPRVKGKRPVAMKGGHVESVRIGRFLVETGWNHELYQYYVQTVRLRFPQPNPTPLRAKFGPVYWHRKLHQADQRRDALKRELAVKATLEAMGIETDD